MKEIAGIRELSLDEVEAVVGGQQWCNTVCQAVGVLYCDDNLICHQGWTQQCNTICY